MDVNVADAHFVRSLHLPTSIPHGRNHIGVGIYENFFLIKYESSIFEKFNQTKRKLVFHLRYRIKNRRPVILFFMLIVSNSLDRGTPKIRTISAENNSVDEFLSGQDAAS